MKWHLPGCLLLAVGAAAAAQPDTDAALRQAIAESEAAASSRWGVAPTLRILPTGNHLRSRPDGRVEISLDAAYRLTDGSTPDQARAILAWVLAHEVWHQVQYRDGFSDFAASATQRRRAECTADIMAGYAVFDADLAQRRSEPTENDVRGIAAKLGSVVEITSSLEEGTGGYANHPESAKRRTAIRYGFVRALKERATSLADNAETRLLRDHLAKVYDIRSGEASGIWAERSCAMILHDGDGVGDLIGGAPAIDWNRDGSPPIVTYRIPYRNEGEKPIEAVLEVRTVMVPRASREDRDSWKQVDGRRYRVTIQPGGEYVLAGTLQWVATEDAMPRLLVPGAPDSFYNARRLGERSADAAGALPSTTVGGLDSSLTELKSQLAGIYNSARRRFELVSHRCEMGEVKVCELVEQPVGIVSNEVVVESDGSARLYLTVYRGDSSSEADFAFRRYYGWLRAIYPAVEFRERNEGALASASMTPTPLADVSLVRRQSAAGEYLVEITVVPRFF